MAPKPNNIQEDPSEDEEEVEYVVERIERWRYNRELGYKQFYVKWEGYPEEQSTWEPPGHLTNVKRLLEQFISNLSPEQSKCFHSRNPALLNGFQRNATFQGCVGSTAPHESDSEDSPKPDKQRFYVIVNFEDSPEVEEVTLSDLAKYEKKAFIEFCERRLLSSNHDR